MIDFVPDFEFFLSKGAEHGHVARSNIEDNPNSWFLLVCACTFY
jgi:hypothetical protein